MNEGSLIPQTIASRASGPAIDPSYRINVHFQPDLVYQDITVIESLATSKVYHSQFRTGISNGGLIATSGRADWENRLFGNFYSLEPNERGADPDSERPKYGALNVSHDLYGAAPRFGSCYFRLTADTLERATFCFPDSYLTPQHFGTAKSFNLDTLAAATSMEDLLDGYIETHVHGPLIIPRDVEAIVLDPSYRGTDVERAAARLGCQVEWHSGYSLLVNELENHPEYRGRHIDDAAIDLAEDVGVLTPEVIGRAYRGSAYSQQETKKVWHYLACFGRGRIRTSE